MDVIWQLSLEERGALEKILSTQMKEETPEANARIASSLADLEEQLQVELEILRPKAAPISQGIVTPKQAVEELVRLENKLEQLQKQLNATSQTVRYGLLLVIDADERNADLCCANGDLLENEVALDASILDGVRHDPVAPLVAELARLRRFANDFQERIQDNNSTDSLEQILRQGGRGRREATVTNRIAMLCGQTYMAATDKRPGVSTVNYPRGELKMGQQYGPFQDFVNVLVVSLKKLLPDLSTQRIARAATDLARPKKDVI